MGDSFTLSVAFIAGLLSFLAPCCAALLPSFLAYIMGVDLMAPPQRGRLHVAAFLNVMAFSVGFTAVFVVVGSALGYLTQLLGGSELWINRFAGGVIILFGLVSLGLIQVPFLEREWKFVQVSRSGLGYAGSLIVGGAFALGWTPCVGPILGGILALAGASASALNGAVLLLAYSAGLMLPFLLSGLSIGVVAGLVRRSGPLLRYFSYVSGVLLIGLGIAVFTNNIQQLSQRFSFAGA